MDATCDILFCDTHFDFLSDLFQWEVIFMDPPLLLHLLQWTSHVRNSTTTLQILIFVIINTDNHTFCDSFMKCHQTVLL